MKKIFSVIISVVMIFATLMIPDFESDAADKYSFSGVAHIQTYGNRNGTWDGTTLTLGTTGQGKRLESVTINFVNHTGYAGSIEYRVHRQTYGWTDWVGSGCPAGTTGEGKRLEAIQIRLTGELAEHYSIKYRVHIQTYGWNQGWQYDGAMAGTEGEAKRLEALEVKLVRKGTETMGVSYRVHRQTYGWEGVYRKNGETSGTTGESKRLEGIEIALTGNEYSGSIKYKTHVQSYGWMNEVSDGMMSGTTGQAKRLEAIQIYLTGEIARYYDIYYKVHAQSYGWLGWAKNGEPAGTAGYSKRLEAIQIMLVPKDANKPASTEEAFIEKDKTQLPESIQKVEHTWSQSWTEIKEPVEIAPAWSYPEYAAALHCRDCGQDSLESTWNGQQCPNCGNGSNYSTAPDMPTGKIITEPPIYEDQVVAYTHTATCSRCGKTLTERVTNYGESHLNLSGTCN